MHLKNYYEIQTLEIVQLLSKEKKRIERSNLSKEISSLQNIFIESFCFAVLAVYKVSLSTEGTFPGVDALQFSDLKLLKKTFKEQQLKNTRYQRSGKSFKVKKTLPKVAEITPDILLELKRKLNALTINLRLQLLKSANMKSYRKNYKSHAVRRI